MPSFASIWNPLSILKETDAEQKSPRVWTFYISGKNALGLRQWSPADGAGAFWEEKDESPAGNIQEGSALAVIRLRDWIRVYGITKFTPKEGNAVHHISLLSPVQQSLGIVAKFGRLAACSNGEIGWLYYIASDPAKIYEVKLDKENTSKANVVDGSTVFYNKSNLVTHLFALFVKDANKRYLFYQTSEGELRFFNVGDKKGYGFGKGVFVPQKGTPLAACSYKDGAKTVVAVYFVQGEGDDAKIIKAYTNNITTDDAQGPTWNVVPTEIEATPSSTTTFSVSVIESTRKNVLVFSSGAGAAGFEHQEDSWP